MRPFIAVPPAERTNGRQPRPRVLGIAGIGNAAIAGQHTAPKRGFGEHGALHGGGAGTDPKTQTTETNGSVNFLNPRQWRKSSQNRR